MAKALVSIYWWENPKLYLSSLNLKKGERVIVPTENGDEIGTVLNPKIKAKDELSEKIVRIATERDIKTYQKYEKEKKKTISVCRQEIKKENLLMKVIDERVSLDGKRITFIFTADGRVDFRQLIRELAKKLEKSIRMQQIGSREEARELGGYGVCGRELCCVKFPGSIPSITTEMARAQQISHRGAERMTGLCGRLMCCLAYEADQYREMLEGMPELYSVVKTSEGKGTVVEINAITQEIKVKTENGKYIILKKEDLK